MCNNLRAGLQAPLWCVRNSGQQRWEEISLWRPQHPALDKIWQRKKMVLISMLFKNLLDLQSLAALHTHVCHPSEYLP